MPASELIERVAELVEEFRPRLAGEAANDIEALLTRLRDPVRVAVVGRVKAGKSTMVNALLGQRVAPTDVSECTKVVTWFHYGHPQRLELVLTDGSRSSLQLSSKGTLPAEVGVPIERVAALHAYLANEALKDLTLIDTPGIASVHEDYSSSTERLLAPPGGSLGATDQTDAVVFLLNQVLMQEEYETLKLFNGSGVDGAASTLGVLSKADKLGDGEEDPWPVAVALASRYAGQFREQVSTVVPVVGLLAESAETATLTEMDTKALTTLARLEPRVFERMLWSFDQFLDADVGVSVPSRERLLVILDLYGIRHAVEVIRAGASGATSVRRELSALSGISQVKRALLAFFGDKDHILKVRSALAIIERLSYRAEDAVDAAAPLELRSRLEALKLDPVMHPVNELEVWQDCRSGKVRLPPEMLAELERLAGPGTPAARIGAPDGDPASVGVAAKEGMVRWRRFMVNEADPSQARVARVAMRSYQLVWTACKEAAG
ncbi:MAG: dynamin family protein [Actinomycetota bacterium]|nr:dynamin family protein [Actinomycetota bacterium]